MASRQEPPWVVRPHDQKNHTEEGAESDRRAGTTAVAHSKIGEICYGHDHHSFMRVAVETRMGGRLAMVAGEPLLLPPLEGGGWLSLSTRGVGVGQLALTGFMHAEALVLLAPPVSATFNHFRCLSIDKGMARPPGHPGRECTFLSLTFGGLAFAA